jgi:hypothetical protein
MTVDKIDLPIQQAVRESDVGRRHLESQLLPQ